ncbi:MAG: hypothetical protein AB1798_00025 [Spirochaetota bacterium]
MIDLILKKIELNENYHQNKEKMAWIATSLYLTFTIVSFRWLHNRSFDYFEEELLTILILAVTYLSALSFVSFQFRHRWQSVYESYALLNLLRQIDTDTAVNLFPDLYNNAMETEKNKRENKRRPFAIMILTLLFPIMATVYLIYRIFGGKKDVIDSRYHTEIPTYAILTYFFLVQIVITF